MHPEFERERKEIGVGQRAKVYYWNGSAYKVYQEDFPVERIQYELELQELVCRTGLPVVHCEKTDDPHIIRMDFIDGITLGDRVQKKGYREAVSDMIGLQERIHAVSGAGFPDLADHLEKGIEQLDFDNPTLERARRYAASIERKGSLCHLDFHPLNILWSNGSYYIVDWCNAECGNPVFDFARSYVILYEIGGSYGEEYLSILLGKGIVAAEEMEKALYIVALFRTLDYDNVKVRGLIAKLSARPTLA